MPTLQSHTFASRTTDTQAKACKRVCLFQRRKNFKIFFPSFLKKLNNRHADQHDKDTETQ